jgi:enamine deaminase RidA (YjgF/YER057c/UK114 family)
MHRTVSIVALLTVGMTIGAITQGARLRHVNPPALSAPTGYTHVVIPQRGRLVFIAGQVSADKAGNPVGKGDFKAQTKQVFENLKTAVAAAGATMADVAKINVYATDLSQLAALREVRQQYFTGNPPASTLVQVVGLARPEYLLEIEAIVVIE